MTNTGAHSKNELDKRAKASPIPDPTRRKMVQGLGTMAVALPAGVLLFSKKKNSANAA